MDYKLIFNLLSKMMLVECGFLLVPAAVSALYGEYSTSLIFLAVALCAALIFYPLSRITKGESGVMYAREAFTLVPLCWLFWSLVGAFPFLFASPLSNYADCLFEAVSGFTTTGATVFADVESLSHGILIWRSLMHWVGGMGVLVFALAIIPMTKTGNYLNLFRAEMTGSDVGKLVPKAKRTAGILYAIYGAMTLVLAILLIAGGMPVFDSINHAFSTAGTGGMSVKNASIGAYNSPYIDAVITVFMFMMGINFTMYFLLLRGKLKDIFRSAELWCYTITFVVVSAVIGLQLYQNDGGTVLHSLRLSCFQTASLMSSTGFATADTNAWLPLSKILLVACMLMGACAGSTGGGIKVSRVQIALKTAYRDVQKQVKPRYVYLIRSEGKVVESSTVSSVLTFIFCYFAIAIASTVIFSFDGMEFEGGFTSAISALSNMGPFFDKTRAATTDYMFMSTLSKLVMSADMLLGRLEIFPIFVMLSPRIFGKKL